MREAVVVQETQRRQQLAQHLRRNSWGQRKRNGTCCQVATGTPTMATRRDGSRSGLCSRHGLVGACDIDTERICAGAALSDTENGALRRGRWHGVREVAAQYAWLRVQRSRTSPVKGSVCRYAASTRSRWRVPGSPPSMHSCTAQFAQ